MVFSRSDIGSSGIANRLRCGDCFPNHTAAQRHSAPLGGTKPEADAMTYETLLTALDQGVMTVTLNRPDKLNAFNPAMSRELIDFFQRVNAMDEVRAVVVTGAGRAFCAGADISAGSGAFQVWNDQAPGGSRQPQKRDAKDSITLAIFDCLKPVVAAINGAAVGVGITMCLPMDVRLMSTTARIGFVFNKRGMAMEAGSCWFLPRLVGMQQAQEWVMTADLFGADEALKGGLVRSIHAPDDLLPMAQALARKFAAGSSSAVAMAVNRRLMWSMLGAQDPLDAVTLDVQCVGWLARNADAQEGVKAFFEKRPPDFPLRPSRDMPPFGPWASSG
jgi:enoyl-CoA hydratase/carnithine racemase